MKTYKLNEHTILYMLFLNYILLSTSVAPPRRVWTEVTLSAQTVSTTPQGLKRDRSYEREPSKIVKQCFGEWYSQALRRFKRCALASKNTAKPQESMALTVELRTSAR